MNEILSDSVRTFRKPEGLERLLPLRIDGRQAALPILIANAGENTARRFLGFFAATIRN